ncbi:MAG: ABC transporter permease [Ruminococcus sp.]|nr:ABC transporter permease [Ruminococcus sp.]
MKFINLLKKELSELVNFQMLIGLVATVAIFMILGGVMKTTVDEAVDKSENVKINICDRDNTEFTENIIKALDELDDDPDSNVTAKLNIIECEGDDYSAILEDNDISGLVIIPEGFTETLDKKEPPEIISVSRMTSAATMSNMDMGNDAAIELIEACISSTIAEDTGMDADQYKLMEKPVILTENTVVDDKEARISPANIMSKIMMQNMLLPIIVFVLIMMTSQMLMTSISNEKIDKTLETLLSAPVSRLSVIGAKMLAAAVVALINAAVYMFAFSVFVSGATDEVTETVSLAAGSSITVDQALDQLGLNLVLSDYLLIGLQLFCTIMICLSVSIILGALIDDAKNVQNMLMPIMMCAMVPYMISILADINELPMVLRILVYAIPFTHTFTAVPNLMFGNNMLFIIGLIYQIIVFIVCIFFSLRLFMSDKLLTVSLNMGQKSKYKKKNRKNSAQDDEE